jgi:hypothetical protein
VIRKSGLRRRTPKLTLGLALIAMLATLLPATAAQASTAPAAEAAAAGVTSAASALAAKPKPKAKAAQKADAACTGTLTWYKVLSCDAIAPDETHTYTLTTAAASESVLVRISTPENPHQLTVEVTGHDIACNLLNGGLERCDLGPAGTYQVTVHNIGDSPHNYDLSAASILGSSCTALAAADLSPNAPGRPADFPAGAVGNCFQFTAAVGDVVRFGNKTSGVSVYDATGASACEPGSWPCKLTGAAPYRAFVVALGTNGPASGAYVFHAAKVNSPAGCAALPIAPFGDLGDAAASGELTSYQTVCRSVTATAGRYSIQLPPVNRMVRDIYDATGAPICPQGAGDCDIPADGTYLVLVEHQSEETSPFPYDLSLVALDKTTGCAAEIGTTWDLPVQVVPLKSRAQLDCHPIDAQPGERILVRTPGPTPAVSRVVDATGQSACEGENTERSGCLLKGDAPYRVLSGAYSGTQVPTNYRLDIGRLSNPVGCVPAVISTFGVQAPTGPDGSRCRELTVTTATTYRIDSAAAYKPDGYVSCDNPQTCVLDPGKYTVVASDDERVAIFPLTSTDGCVEQPADTFAVQSGTLAGPSQYDCVTLGSPSGSEVLTVEPSGSWVTEGFVLDATGNGMCLWGPSADVRRCELVGTAPFRAVIYRDHSQKGASDYRMAFPRFDVATGCRPLPQSDFSAPGGVAISLRPDRFVSCLSVPAGEHAAEESFEYARTGSVGSAQLLTVTSDPGQGCEGKAGPAKFTLCSLTEGKAYTVLFVGSNDTAGYRLARRDVTSGARGCTAVGSTVLGATSGTGTLTDPSVVRCFKVSGAAGDQFLVNTVDVNSSIGASVLRPSGEYVCKTFGESRCLAKGSDAYQVLVWNDSFLGAASFKLETAKVVAAGAPAAECARPVETGYGFGPIAGEVTATKTSTCTAFSMTKYKSVSGTVVNQAAGGDAPFFRGMATQPDALCYDIGDGQGGFQCNAGSADRTQVVVLSLPEDKSTTLKYTMNATCENPLCGGATFGVTGVSPATRPGGGVTTIALKGKALHVQDVVTLTATGKPTVTGVVKSVSVDRTAATVSVNLADAAAGVRDVTVESFAGQSATLAGVFTVGAPAFSVVTAPTVVAPVAVGTVAKSTPGTWSPAGASYAYQWRNNGAVITGATAATYAVPAGLLARQLSVTVTASKAGVTSIAATSAAVVVAKGAAPVATAPPVLTGTVQAGHTVTTSAGSWSPACTTLAYQWYLAGKAVAGATTTKLALTAAMAGKTVYAGVTCARTGHNSGQAVTKTFTVRA